MADLTLFVHSDLTSGTSIDIYANRWPKFGEGKVEALQPLYLKISGEGELRGIVKAQGSVAITMPDTAPRGTCTVEVVAKGHSFGREFDVNDRFSCEYTSTGGDQPKLYILLPSGRLELHNRDREWTWVHPGISGVPWIGLWPAGRKLSVDDTVGDI